MATRTRFHRAVIVSTRPWGVYISLNGSDPVLAKNALGQRIGPGTELLVSETRGVLTVIGKRTPDA